jgi:hypothetical protein
MGQWTRDRRRRAGLRVGDSESDSDGNRMYRTFKLPGLRRPGPAKRTAQSRLVPSARVAAAHCGHGTHRDRDRAAAVTDLRGSACSQAEIQVGLELPSRWYRDAAALSLFGPFQCGRRLGLGGRGGRDCGVYRTRSPAGAADSARSPSGVPANHVEATLISSIVIPKRLTPRHCTALKALGPGAGTGHAPCWCARRAIE